MLFLSIFGSILGLKIDEFSTKNAVIFLIAFWMIFSLIFFDFWCNVVKEVYQKSLILYAFYDVFLMLRLFSLDG